MKTRLKINAKKSSGFALLYGILLVTAVLYITIGISNIISRQVSLSGAGRDSLYAFYAADAAHDCALYEDLVEDSFSGSAVSVSCNGTSVLPTKSGNTYAWTWALSGNLCADVSVAKQITGNTTVVSRGYNDCSSGASRRVERAVQTDY